MTRKRLIKLLMNLGLSRNQANNMAAQYRRIGMPYVMGYVDFIICFNSRSVEEHCKEMYRLRSEVENQTGEKYRTFRKMGIAMLRIAKHSSVELG